MTQPEAGTRAALLSDTAASKAATGPASLVHLCFAAMTRSFGRDDPAGDELLAIARFRLPTELKEQLFDHFCDSTLPTAPANPLPRPAYPEDRYRDVQLVNRITCQRVIPLCFAMWSSLDYCYEKVRRLVEDEVCDVNESDLDGFCPLHYAAIYSRVEACKLLLRHGADCCKANNFKKTALDLAQDRCIQLMIKLRVALFTQMELGLMQAEAKRRRKEIAKLQRCRMKDEFLMESAHLSSVLEKKSRQLRSSPREPPRDPQPPQQLENATIFHNNDL